jgi:tetratricopeptide (TPR) repeat protein
VDWLKQSASLVAQNRREEARQIFQKAKSLYPNDPALGDFEKALTTEPAALPPPSQGNDPVVERLLAESEIYLRKGRADLARETWKRVIQVDPGNAEVKARLESELPGASQSKTASPGERARAQSLYEKGLKAYLSGDTRKAVGYWEEALNADPQHMNALNNLVRAKLELSIFRSNPPSSEGTSP